jgi:hypothetical protein
MKAEGQQHPAEGDALTALLAESRARVLARIVAHPRRRRLLRWGVGLGTGLLLFGSGLGVGAAAATAGHKATVQSQIVTVTVECFRSSSSAKPFARVDWQEFSIGHRMAFPGPVCAGAWYSTQHVALLRAELAALEARAESGYQCGMDAAAGKPTSAECSATPSPTTTTVGAAPSQWAVCGHSRGTIVVIGLAGETQKAACSARDLTTR